MARNGALIAPDTYKEAVAITLSDSTTYDRPFDAFMVGADGNVSITDLKDVTTVIKGLLAGVIYPLGVTKFNETSTTATDLVGLRF